MGNPFLYVPTLNINCNCNYNTNPNPTLNYVNLNLNPVLLKGSAYRNGYTVCVCPLGIVVYRASKNVTPLHKCYLEYNPKKKYFHLKSNGLNNA